MMRNSTGISILDCTLRDGGHLTNGVFGELMIKKTIENLIEAKVDIIEVGFLMEESYGMDTARFKTIADVKRILPENRGESKISLMADFINLEDLEPNDGTVDIIRLSFKRQRLKWALDTALILKDKGYKCFINPVNCNVYTDEEYLKVIEQVNKIKPYAFSIVDTFGVLRKNDLSRLYYLVENNLDPEIGIGLHLHENLGISYLLAQHFVEIHNPRRRISIDGSLLGMGRAPGNLCTEQIIDYMNERYGYHYVLEPALDIINDYIEPLKEEKKWGYSIPYALSAKYKLHRTYAEFLMNKWKLGMKDIQRILSQVSIDEAEYFNETYIEQLYLDYVNVEIDDAEDTAKLMEHLKNKKVMLIAPGSSIETYKEEIRKCASKDDVCVIAVGFIPDFVSINFAWISSIKRYKQILWSEADTKIIITSNIKRDASKFDYILNYNKLLYHNEKANDNSLLLLLNFLKKNKIKEVCLAGFDGFHDAKTDYYGELTNLQIGLENNNQGIKEVLRAVYNDVSLQFLTPSIFE